MPNFNPTYALGGDQPKVEQINGVELTEFPDIALISIALRHGPDPIAAEIKKATGLAQPKPGQAIVTAERALMWLGPDLFMYELPYEQGEAEFSNLKAALGDKLSLTDQSDVWVAFDLKGSNSLAVLERLVMLDVHAMRADDFARTTLDHSGVLLRCVLAGEAFRIYATRSYARSVWHAIQTAMESLL